MRADKARRARDYCPHSIHIIADHLSTAKATTSCGGVRLRQPRLRGRATVPRRSPKGLALVLRHATWFSLRPDRESPQTLFLSYGRDGSSPGKRALPLRILVRWN